MDTPLTKKEKYNILHENLAKRTGITPNNVARLRGILTDGKITTTEATLLFVKKLQNKLDTLKGLEKNIAEYHQLIDFLASNNKTLLDEIILAPII